MDRTPTPSHVARGHRHAHAPGAPHPAAAVSSSLLRLAAPARLAGAAAVCALMWGMIAMAMR